MMLRALILLAAGILATRPAAEPQGRLLTVAESVGQADHSVYPAATRVFWTADGRLTREFPRPKRPEWKLPEPEGPGIVYGQSVSRNEFGINGGIFPSPDSTRLAVYRKDESAVTLYPLYDIASRTGGAQMIRYPMAGMASEHISLCVTDLAGNILSTMQVSDFDEERYLTGISWSPDGKYIFIQVVDRSQHEMHLNMYRSDNGAFVRTILTERNDAWVEPLDPLHFIKGSYQFLYRTDNRDGYRNLYRCDTLGHIERITPVEADVEYVANDGRYVYYTSAEVSPVENHLFRVRIDRRKLGAPQRLTPEEGWHNVSLSPDCSRFIDRYSSFNVPGVTQVRSTDGKLVEVLGTAPNPLEGYAQCRMEFGTTPSADGRFDNYYRLYYPKDFDPAKKYPLIVYVYGGPHSQMVNDSWLGGVRMWEMLMAQRGYVVYVQDNRGTPNRGAAFEKAINRQCGQAEADDQMAGINALLERSPWIDRERIGVHGWSYGGYMTLTLATRTPGFFKVAVAGGPVIDWQWYEVMYGERYMDNPATNPEGFARTSLIPHAKDLTGHVLICQGMLDGTVVPQHSLSFVQECIKEGVPVDWFPYPQDEHNMRGKARVHLYEKITDYFETFL